MISDNTQVLSLIDGKINYDINDIIVTKSMQVTLFTSVNIYVEILLLVT